MGRNCFSNRVVNDGTDAKSIWNFKKLDKFMDEDNRWS
ncbi:hypothetical protein E2C01_016612 [Portunus trituberculatus]|uniref:Uncharacterized protein n=1 Tax=Portunus trituberculatus TaxID=210409 RepID=A0A5B7DR11_PORTR|nr:hypothetical protein [Portunus trituberculatus]